MSLYSIFFVFYGIYTIIEIKPQNIIKIPQMSKNIQKSWMRKVLEWNFGNSNLYKKILIPHSDIKISINKWPKLLDLLCAYNAVLKWYHLVLDLYLHVSKCIELHFDMLGWELPLYSCIEIVSKFISITL